MILYLSNSGARGKPESIMLEGRFIISEDFITWTLSICRDKEKSDSKLSLVVGSCGEERGHRANYI